MMDLQVSIKSKWEKILYSLPDIISLLESKYRMIKNLSYIDVWRKFSILAANTFQG